MPNFRRPKEGSDGPGGGAGAPRAKMQSLPRGSGFSAGLEGRFEYSDEYFDYTTEHSA